MGKGEIMYLKPRENLLVAETLLQCIKARLSGFFEDTKGSVWYECFDNCREQGFVIIVWNKKEALRIAFSENRNSDDIVIYTYRKNSGISNLPAQEEWENSKYFGWGKYTDATEYIFQLIKKELEE